MCRLMPIKEIDLQTSEQIIDNRKKAPPGRFWVKENEWYVGIDNTTHDAWTEDFTTKEECLKWLENSDDT